MVLCLSILELLTGASDEGDLMLDYLKLSGEAVILLLFSIIYCAFALHLWLKMREIERADVVYECEDTLLTSGTFLSLLFVAYMVKSVLIVIYMELESDFYVLFMNTMLVFIPIKSASLLYMALKDFHQSGLSSDYSQT